MELMRKGGVVKKRNYKREGKKETINIVLKMIKKFQTSQIDIQVHCTNFLLFVLRVYMKYF